MSREQYKLFIESSVFLFLSFLFAFYYTDDWLNENLWQDALLIEGYLSLPTSAKRVKPRFGSKKES